MNSEQLKQLENNLWTAKDKLCANTDLKSSEYAITVLGLIFLKFVDTYYSGFTWGVFRWFFTTN